MTFIGFSMFEKSEFIAYASYLVAELKMAYEQKPTPKLASIIKSCKIVIDFAHKASLEAETKTREIERLRHERNRIIKQLRELRDEN